MENLEKITLIETLKGEQFLNMLRRNVYRGVFTKEGKAKYPYKEAEFSLATVHPSLSVDSLPSVEHQGKRHPLYTPQPTIYQNQTEILRRVDQFLQTIDKNISNLGLNCVHYDWEERGDFHVSSPIIEKHTYRFKNGFLDLDFLAKKFTNSYTKDFNQNLHHLAKRYLTDYFIDELSSIKHLDIFHETIEIINYGINFSGDVSFFIICDGAHRVDFSIEQMRRPTDVIVVESETMLPYYALPRPFKPSIRLSSKQAEEKYRSLDIDKIHIFNRFLKKMLHYIWAEDELKVSSLRSNHKPLSTIWRKKDSQEEN